MEAFILVVIGTIIVIAILGDWRSNNNNSSSSTEENTPQNTFGTYKKQWVGDMRSKYNERIIDTTLSLFERNKDIIEWYSEEFTIENHDFEMDDLVTMCLNEICLAENQPDIYPGDTSLKFWKDFWKSKVPQEWVELLNQVTNYFERKKIVIVKKSQLSRAREQAEMQKQILIQKEYATKVLKLQRYMYDIENKIEGLKNKFSEPYKVIKIYMREGSENIVIDDIPLILKLNQIPWYKVEQTQINYKCNCEKISEVKPEEFPEVSLEDKKLYLDPLNADIQTFNNLRTNNIEGNNKSKDYFVNMTNGYSKKNKDDVIERINNIINNIDLPTSLPKKWNIDFDPEQGILIVELKLPDVVHNEIYKYITLKSGNVKKPLNQTEKKEKVPNIHPAIILRLAYEIFRNDEPEIIKLLVINGWVEYDNPSTGILTKTYTASLAVEKEKILSINLEKIDPLSAFTNLKGKSAGKLIDIIPVTPVMTLDKKDKRFIETKDVLNKIGEETNLASMDWQDFEMLISELFAKEFEKEGGEVKVTQSSRDRGVDAVVFDPDPIKGGKFVIQAKRYTNTVDVSAVRDLCAVVKKEGASRGILVTTSTYGADAYTFANNEPVTLLNGAELLGLLKKHGYEFRINLAEARKINQAN